MGHSKYRSIIFSLIKSASIFIIGADVDKKSNAEPGEHQDGQWCASAASGRADDRPKCYRRGMPWLRATAVITVLLGACAPGKDDALRYRNRRNIRLDAAVEGVPGAGAVSGDPACRCPKPRALSLTWSFAGVVGTDTTRFSPGAMIRLVAL